MDLFYGQDNERYREVVRAFLEREWRPSARIAERRMYVTAFRARATEAGYLYRGIPRVYGGSEQAPDVIKAQIIREEFKAAGAPMEVGGNGMTMVVPTLLERGSDWQKTRFIPPTLRGEFNWAQGYSEPGAGSDLASLKTRGELVDGEWIINGQKIWTSLAHKSQYMFALVRTEPDTPKHLGISYLLIDMRQPGITVRPLRQMTGASEFCEVFLDDVRTPADWIVGQRGEGWKISNVTLKHERATIGGSDREDERFAKLVALAKKRSRCGRPAIESADVRQALAELECWVAAQKYSTFRRFSLAAASEEPGMIGLAQKLVTTEIAHRTAVIAQMLIGNSALLDPGTAEAEPGVRRGDEKWLDQIMGSLALAIAGGASNIQRNIVGERGLGLPKDLVPGRGGGAA